MNEEPTPRPAPDRFRNFLALCLIGVFVGMLPVLIFKEMPTANEQVIVYIIGQLSGMATTCLAFYFTQKVGQDALDAKRVDNTTAALTAITETTKFATSTAPPSTEPQEVKVVNEPHDPVPTTTDGSDNATEARS